MSVAPPVAPVRPERRGRRRAVRRVLLSTGLLALGIGLGLLFSHADLVPARLDQGRPGARVDERRWTEPGEPARELAAVLEVLFKPEAATQGGPPPVDANSPAPAEPAPPAQPAAAPVRDLAKPEDARAIQNRLAELGYLPPNPPGTWGPEQFDGLRMFRQVRGLGSDPVWDEVTEEALFDPKAREADAFVGRWAPDLAACGPRNRTRLLPAIINQQGAWAGDVFCSFANARREGPAWTFAANCASGRRRWTSNVRIEVNGDVLTWASERGSQTYRRCPST